MLPYMNYATKCKNFIALVCWALKLLLSAWWQLHFDLTSTKLLKWKEKLLILFTKKKIIYSTAFERSIAIFLFRFQLVSKRLYSRHYYYHYYKLIQNEWGKQSILKSEEKSLTNRPFRAAHTLASFVCEKRNTLSDIMFSFEKNVNGTALFFIFFFLYFLLYSQIN